ncbi:MULTISPECIES: twin-arginine translocase subunit TatC [Bacillaceae]|uniref:Sec-independent protein translocase protein TatC n=1 Tax=Metabacillus sediminis TaxID=3117746 RepID=A0ABZ2NMV5_9BACI|nr:twin-arginine translocase subunit TatC [Bacillus sp. SJS]KZZ83034.1 preprotein translocase subunit TatC [Bacillus sp. SJS]
MSQMTFWQRHLEELRKRLLLTGIAYAVFLGIGFFLADDLYRWFLIDTDIKLTVLGPSEIMWVYFSMANIMAIAAVFPVAAHQLWAFVGPALTTEEKKAVYAFVPAIGILFAGGICFGYFVVFPSALGFLLNMSDGLFTALFTTEKYFGFLFQIVLPFGFLFELPAAVVFLTNLGLITPGMMRKYRKYVYFVLAILSAVITPPDFSSQLFVLIPMAFLFEASIFLAAAAVKRKNSKGDQEPLQTI